MEKITADEAVKRITRSTKIQKIVDEAFIFFQAYWPAPDQDAELAFRVGFVKGILFSQTLALGFTIITEEEQNGH